MSKQEIFPAGRPYRKVCQMANDFQPVLLTCCPAYSNVTLEMSYLTSPCSGERKTPLIYCNNLTKIKMSLEDPTSFLSEESSMEKLVLAYGRCLVNICWLYLTEKRRETAWTVRAANCIMQPKPQIGARKMELSFCLYWTSLLQRMKVAIWMIREMIFTSDTYFLVLNVTY